MKKLIICLIALCLFGCGVNQNRYGVSCDQYGHLSTIVVNDNGTYHPSEGNMNPPAQYCKVLQDGSIIVMPLQKSNINTNK